MADESRADKWRLIRSTNLKTEDRFCLLTLFLIQGDNDAAFCKQETLADEIGVHTRSVRRSLQRLNAAGIVRSDWQIRSGVPMRHYAIDFDRLKSVQRGGRTPASYLETFDGRTPVSTTAGRQCPKPQDTSVLQERSIEHPLKIQRGRAGKSDERRTAFCIEWNVWHSAGIVRSKIRDTALPGKTIESAWNRSQRDSEQRERLSDVQALRAAIEASQQYLQPAGWFDAAGLIGGKNSNRRWYAEQLIAGTYRDKSNGMSAANAEAETAWQAVLDSLKRRSRFKPDEIMGEIGERAWQALRPIGLKRIDEANDFERRELKAKFIQAFSRQGEVT